MTLAHNSMEIIKVMAETGNPNSVSDAGVGALCARTAVIGAFLNVKINTGGLKDKEYGEAKIAEGQALVDKSIAAEEEILKIVEGKMT